MSWGASHPPARPGALTRIFLPGGVRTPPQAVAAARRSSLEKGDLVSSERICDGVLKMTHTLLWWPFRLVAGRRGAQRRPQDSRGDFLVPPVCPSPASPALPPPTLHDEDLDGTVPRAPGAVIKVEEVAFCPPSASAALPPRFMVIISTAEHCGAQERSYRLEKSPIVSRVVSLEHLLSHHNKSYGRTKCALVAFSSSAGSIPS